ncbi:hypothetical protein [Nocardioides hungaricus]
MTYARHFSLLAIAAATAIAVGGCASDGQGSSATPTLTSTPSSSSPTPTTTAPTPRSDSELASQAASALVARYYATVDRLGQQPAAPLARLSGVAAGVQLTAQQTLLRSQRKAAQRQVGDTTIVKLDVQSINLDNSDPAAGKMPTIQIDVCWDVSEVDVVDASGESVVTSSRPDTGWTRLTIANNRYAADATRGWRVTTGEDLEKAPCVTS